MISTIQTGKTVKRNDNKYDEGYPPSNKRGEKLQLFTFISEMEDCERRILYIISSLVNMLVCFPKLSFPFFSLLQGKTC